MEKRGPTRGGLSRHWISFIAVWAIVTAIAGTPTARFYYGMSGAGAAASVGRAPNLPRILVMAIAQVQPIAIPIALLATAYWRGLLAETAEESEPGIDCSRAGTRVRARIVVAALIAVSIGTVALCYPQLSNWLTSMLAR